MTRTTTKHDTKALLGELEAAEREFMNSATLLTQATDFLSSHKGRLNEHQFVEKLEAAGSNKLRANEVIENQNRLRCSYQSGRLALFCAFSRLAAGLQGRDRVVRTIMKLVATIPHIEDSFERNLLGSRCLAVTQQCDTVYSEALERYRKESQKDLTNGLAQESLIAAYNKLCSAGISGQESDPKYQTEFTMCLIPLNLTDLKEYVNGFTSGKKVNDQLVEVANSAATLLASEEYRRSLSAYYCAKTNLNEPQYGHRLQIALTGDNAQAVEVIKQQQQYQRIQFLSHRLSVTELYHQLHDLAAQISALAAELKKHIAEDGKTCPTHALVAMNNVIAAEAICQAIRLLSGKWASELENTEDSRDRAQNSLHELLGAIVGKPPYNSRRWTCYGPGSYVEPL